MKIRSYAKSELALLYFPGSDPHVATVRLTGWIRHCRELPGVQKDCPCFDASAEYRDL